MSRIFLFRGKAATGKTTMTDLLSKELNVAVLRKDDIYDKLSEFNLEHSEKNKASYDILVKLLQTNIDTNSNLIIDASLAHNPYLNYFLSQIDLKGSKIYKFLCICSNHDEWKKRIEKRINNPSPNQIFSSVQEAEQHYKKYDIAQAENEIILDSSDDITIIMKKVCKVIG